MALDVAVIAARRALLVSTTTLLVAGLLDVALLAAVGALLGRRSLDGVDSLDLGVRVDTRSGEMQGVPGDHDVEVHRSFWLVHIFIHVIGDHADNSTRLALHGRLDEEENDVLNLDLGLMNLLDQSHNVDDKNPGVLGVGEALQRSDGLHLPARLVHVEVLEECADCSREDLQVPDGSLNDNESWT